MNYSESNIVNIGDNINLSGNIIGDNNYIDIKSAKGKSDIIINMQGDNNIIEIDDPIQINGLKIYVGSRIKAYKTHLKIGKNFSVQENVIFFLYNNFNILTIGNDCMFSNSIIVRCGESPHLIFDSITKEYIDKSEGVFIGNHVWIGERSYITKKSYINDENIVAACSVVTKKFYEKNTVIAGNPAKVVKKNVQWVKTRAYLVKDSEEYISYWNNYNMAFQPDKK